MNFYPKTKLGPYLLVMYLPLLGLAQSDGEDGSIINLDPFVVSTESIRGYQVRNTLSATKFDALIKEVPITVTSLTREFLEDTYALNLEDSVKFTAGITTGASQSAEESGGFYIRGLRSLRSKRNGLTQLYSQDMTNVERVEVVKGPMSLLYGQVEPGGIINYLTMRPLKEQRTTVQLTVGSHDHYRAQINHTGPIFKGTERGRHEVLYRFDASYKSDGGWRDNTEDERSFWSGLLQYSPIAGSTFTVQWDYLNQNSYNAAPLPQINRQWREIFLDLVDQQQTPSGNLGLRVLAGQDPFRTYAMNTMNFTDPATGDPYVFYTATSSEPRIWDSYGEHWGRTNNFVPVNAFNDVDQHTVSFEWRQKLGDQWNARLYVVHNNIVRHSVWGNVWAVGISGDKSAGYSWNHWKRTNQDYNTQFELTGKWELGKLENQTFIGLEYADDTFRGSVATGGADNIINPEIADSVRNDNYNPITGSSFTAGNAVIADLSRPLLPQNFQDRIGKAAFISNIFRLFDDRLLVLGGVRFDEIKSQRRESPGLPVNVSDALSKQFGTSYKINERVNVYASYSESFVPQNGFVSQLKSDAEIQQELQKPPAERDFTNQDPLSPIRGEGFEVGLKFDVLDDRISGSMAIFKVDLVGVSKSFLYAVPGAFDNNGNPQSTVIGNQNNGREVTGFETELFFRPQPNWQIVLTYAFLDSKEILNALAAEVREGNQISTNIPTLSVPDHQIGLWTKYSFEDGFMSGFSIGGGFTWLDRRYGAYTLRAENPAANSFVGSDDSVESEILMGSQITWDMMLSYEIPSQSRVRHSLQLNLRNITNEKFVQPGGMPSDPFQAYLSLRTNF